MTRRPVTRYQVEAETPTSSMKVLSKLTLFGTLATMALLWSFTPNLGLADVFGQSHARCRNEASLLQFWIPSSDRGTSENRAQSRSCSFDYGISLSQTGASLDQGTSISLAVSVSLSRGIAGPIDLSLRQIPDGLKLGLNPSSGEPPFDSQLSISAGALSKTSTAYYSFNWLSSKALHCMMI